MASFFFFRLLPLSLRHFRRMSLSVLIRTRAVSDVEVAGSRVKTSVWLRRATCRGGHVEAVFFSPNGKLKSTEETKSWHFSLHSNYSYLHVRVTDIVLYPSPQLHSTQRCSSDSPPCWLRIFRVSESISYTWKSHTFVPLNSACFLWNSSSHLRLRVSFRKLSKWGRGNWRNQDFKQREGGA